MSSVSLVLAIAVLAEACVRAASETTIRICDGSTRTVALDDLDWGNEPMLHRLRLKEIDTFPTDVLRIDADAGAQAFSVTAGTMASVAVNVVGEIVESGKELATTMVVAVEPASRAGGDVCIQLSGSIYCDGSPRNNQRDAGETGFPGLQVGVSVETPAGATHAHWSTHTNSQGQWYSIVYLPAGEWRYKAMYVFNDQSTSDVEVVRTSAAADSIALDGVPVPSLGVCEITRFSTLLIVANDCRCRIVDINGALEADVDAAPVVINRPLTFIGVGAASIDASAFPPGVPLFVAEGMHAEFGMKTLSIRTTAGPAAILADGTAHQIVATTFTFDAAPAISVTALIPRLEISWCIFDITQSTHGLAEPAYAVDNTVGAWGENSVLLRNSVHTPTCLDEKLFLTQRPSSDDDGSAQWDYTADGGGAGYADILFTHVTCGADNTPSDPCIYGISNARSGECECEYGCSGDLCADDHVPEKPTVYVCYYSHTLAKKVPLQLAIDKAEMLMKHAESFEEFGDATDGGDDDPVHVLRDECADVGYVPNGLCSKYGPDIEYRCNCGAPGDLNHTVSTSDLQQVLSEIADVVLLARRAEVKSYAEDNEAYRNGFWLNATFMPVFLAIVVAYLISQVESWSYEHKIESAYAPENADFR